MAGNISGTIKVNKGHNTGNWLYQRRNMMMFDKSAKFLSGNRFATILTGLSSSSILWLMESVRRIYFRAKVLMGTAVSVLTQIGRQANIFIELLLSSSLNMSTKCGWRA